MLGGDARLPCFSWESSAEASSETDASAARRAVYGPGSAPASRPESLEQEHQASTQNPQESSAYSHHTSHISHIADNVEEAYRNASAWQSKFAHEMKLKSAGSPLGQEGR